MKTLSFVTLSLLLSISACSHHTKSCCAKDKAAMSCSKEDCKKACCNKEKKCTEGSCTKDQKSNCTSDSCPKKS